MTALGEVDVAEAFMPASAPHEFGLNEYYGSSEEYVLAIAEALREEYHAIIDAGLILQVDDPFLIDLLMEDREPAQRRAIAQAHVEMVNHALRGIPTERVRLQHLLRAQSRTPPPRRAARRGRRDDAFDRRRARTRSR